MPTANEVPIVERLELATGSVAEETLAELKQLVPGAFGEDGKLDWEKLRRLLGSSVSEDKERYSLTWAGKREAIQAVQRPGTGALVPMPEESVDWDTTENVIIEGDNLEVLKLMQKAYHGRVKMIYIDPPYNTGNDFIYPDNFREGLQTYLEYSGQAARKVSQAQENENRSGRLHSAWLSMMYPRLFLARNLLREDGYLVASIDDAELQNFRLLMNEVFGEENFIAVLVWDRNRKNDAKFFSVGHEYMLVYARNKGLLREQGTELRADKEGVEDVRQEFERLCKLHKGDWSQVRQGLKEWFGSLDDDDPRLPLARYSKVDDKGPYRDDGNPSWPGGGGPMYPVIHPATHKPVKLPSRGWVFPTKEAFDREYAKGRIVFGKDETTIPSIRTNLFEQDTQVMRSVHFSYAQTAAVEFSKLFGGKKVFDNPKPVPDIAKLSEYLAEPGDLILDFFAGSGTTGHAVLESNSKTGAKRRFILVQLPEVIKKGQPAHGLYPHIAALTRDRVKRAVIDLRKQQGMGSDLGYRAFRLTGSHFLPWEDDTGGDAEKLADKLRKHTQGVLDQADPQGVLFEILLKSGYPLSVPISSWGGPPQSASAGPAKESAPPAPSLGSDAAQVYSVDNGKLLVNLSLNLTDASLRAMLAATPDKIVVLDDGFQGNDSLKANIAQQVKQHNAQHPDQPIDLRTV